VLGGWSRPHRWPDLRGHGDARSLDLEKHHDILLAEAVRHPNAARVFADCLVATQPGFFKFAYALIEAFPNDPMLAAGLDAAVLQQTGVGSELNHLSAAVGLVKFEIEWSAPSPTAQRWLDALRILIERKESERQRYFGTHDPPYFSD
jgi:hypothetical protein